VHAGLAPGVTTLVAADLLAMHPGADAVEVGLTFSKASVSGRTGAEFAFRLLTARAHHPTAVLPLPPPFGVRRCMDVGMASEGWFGRLADGRSTALFVCIAERSLHAGLLAANDLRLIGRLPRRFFVPAEPTLPAGPSLEPICEWVAVRRDGRCVGAATVEGEGDYRSTAAVTVVLADVVMAARARVPSLAGVVGPEAICTLADVRAPLAAGGVRVTARS